MFGYLGDQIVYAVFEIRRKEFTYHTLIFRLMTSLIQGQFGRVQALGLVGYRLEMEPGTMIYALGSPGQKGPCKYGLSREID
jgi:hypothetical protein